jgi:hypothetical protein
MADIEHSQIPSEHCHEPKGAPEAYKGYVYVADGAGSGSFMKLPLSSLDTSTVALNSVKETSIDDTVTLDAASLTQVGDGHLEEIIPVVGIDAEMFNTINKNFAELYRIYLNQVTINQSVQTAMENTQDKVNEIVNALKKWGIAG